jgi:hypothetical protein
MAKGKQPKGVRPTLTIHKEPGNREKVEKMFAGDTADVSPGNGPMMHVEASIPLPEHADSGDAKSVKDIVDRIDALFDSIGTDNLPDTRVPPGRENKGHEAAEFVVAQRLKKRAEARYEKAKKNAEEVGCFGSDDQYVSGETVEVYRTGSFTFSVQRNRDSEVIDKDLVEETLKELAPQKWRELLQRCKKPRKGATQYVVALR